MKGSLTEIKVFFLAAEAVPFIKVGGLGDVAGALPLALRQIHHLDDKPVKLDIRVAIPYHPQIDQSYKNTPPTATFFIKSLNSNHRVRVYSADVGGVVFYLIDAAIIDNAPVVYSQVTSEDGIKFTLFSLAALKLIETISWKPNILHVNDWHTALAAYLNVQPGSNRIPHSILTLHNLPFMGAGTESSLAEFQIPPATTEDLPIWGRSQPLPMGLSAVDRIIPVSLQYAQEIQTMKFGCGLNRFLKKNRQKITGILNGIDTQVWDPLTDPLISTNFGPVTLIAKQKNKIALQNELNLPEDADIPLLVLISRMDIQKGIDIALQTLRGLASTRWQTVILGSGDPRLEKECLALEKKYKKRVRSILKFDSDLSHRMYAGGDILLMPSRYEPCGLSQLIAMRYGCIPVATATGGLKDTITNAPRKRKTGYLVRHPDVDLFSTGLSAAIQDFSDKIYWSEIRVNAMKADFSWGKSALKYARVYSELVQTKADEK